MKQLILNILKVFLGICLLLIGFSLVFGLVLFLGWPWWVGFFVLLGLVGVSVGFLFLRKLFQRRREQHFVEQVISQESAHAAKLGDKDRERSRELAARWKEAMDALRSSHLKKRGNPLYVLPWYLVIGESGAGKTTSIKSARLSSPFAEVSKTSGISGTRNCDWWFFEQAVIIDTAGRYAIPVDEGKDKEEWQKFLTQLARFRKREPLNGLVITVAADKLLSARPEALEEDGKALRLRIDELMRVLGAKFPVYLLVSKCDLVQGMTHFCSRLPEKALDQAMGLLNHTLTADVLGFQERAMHTMGERLKDLRLQLLHQPGAKKADPELLLFPEEFERLKNGLLSFSKGAFQENPYQETPLLRGTYFSSGRQEGSPFSHFLKAMGLIGQQDVLPGTSKGMFLFDFFSKILPGDRGLFTQTLHAMEWSRLTRNLGLTAWMAILIAVCGLLSFSFVKNLRTVKDISSEFTSMPVLQGEMLSDVILMDRFRQTILKTEDRNRNWWVPRFGLKESLTVETRMKDTYDQQFRESLLSNFDKQMTDRMSGFTSVTAPRDLGTHIVHLVRRINLLNQRLGGKDMDALQKLPQPGYGIISTDASGPLAPELKDRFHNLYLFDLIWRKDAKNVTREITTLQTWLKHLLGLTGNDLSWLTAWVDAESGLPGVSLADYWGPAGDPSTEKVISPAYTVKGKETIDRFIAEMESALPDALMMAGGKQSFQEGYKQSYLTAWREFSAGFPDGQARLSGKADHQKIVDRIAAGEGPYAAYLDRIVQELAAYQTETDPPWITLVYRYDAVRQQAAAKKTTGGILGKADQKLQGLITKVEKKTGGTEAGQALAEQLAAVSALNVYQDTLAAVAKRESTRKGAFDVAADAFRQADSGEAVETPAQFLAADKALQTLRTSLGTEQAESDIFFTLLSGSEAFLWEFAVNESACYLNKLWEDKVLLSIDGMTDRQEINAKVLGDSGLATALVAGEAAPFIDRSLQKGYFARTALGKQIAFDDAFFSYLLKGKRAMAAAAKPAAAPEKPAATGPFNVTIKGMPTDVNPEARVKPHATHLDVQCGEQSTKLTNLNYPVKKTFEWTLGACQDVVFSIEVGSLVLKKRYAGATGFPDFLKEFGQGVHKFYAKDFPDQQGDLEKLKISFIQINYVFDGHLAVIDAVKKSKVVPAGPSIPGVPKAMAQCWDQ